MKKIKKNWNFGILKFIEQTFSANINAINIISENTSKNLYKKENKKTLHYGNNEVWQQNLTKRELLTKPKIGNGTKSP